MLLTITTQPCPVLSDGSEKSVNLSQGCSLAPLSSIASRGCQAHGHEHTIPALRSQTGLHSETLSQRLKSIQELSLKCFLLICSLSNTLKTTDDADDAAGHKSFICATMQTGFCDWSARYFAQPVMKVSPVSCTSTASVPTGSPHSAFSLPRVLAAASCSLFLKLPSDTQPLLSLSLAC